MLLYLNKLTNIEKIKLNFKYSCIKLLKSILYMVIFLDIYFTIEIGLTFTFHFGKICNIYSENSLISNFISFYCNINGFSLFYQNKFKIQPLNFH